nr:hypothetical protein [Gemmatimonadota bacterium]
MPIHSATLLPDLRRQLRRLEDDLRERVQQVPELAQALRAEYQQGREAGRIGDAFEVWREEQLTQAAVHWVLA